MVHLPSGLPETSREGQIIVGIARSAIEEGLGFPEKSFPDLPWLRTFGATFVTLTLGGNLHGCIGSLLPSRPLRTDIRENARAAAFHDPRFLPVTRPHLKDLGISVSLLSPMEQYLFLDLEDLARQISKNREGLLLEWKHRTATYLPEVWEQIPDPAQFIGELLKKGRIPPNALPPELRAYHYKTTIMKES
ncbi:MAG: AmmeMemoRadiSam system protein A [Leptospirillum sp.]